MKTFEEIKNILKEVKPELKERYKVKEIGIFGSYVKGKKNKKSDVDILIAFEEVPTLFKFVELENYLKDLIGLKTDLVMKSALKPYIGKIILKEVVYI